jgi:hypothetical protein
MTYLLSRLDCIPSRFIPDDDDNQDTNFISQPFMFREGRCELTVAIGYSARACANMDFGKFSGNSLGMISGLRPYIQ